MGLVQHYSSIHDWSEATKWADVAAEQGNDEAKYRSVIYHSIAIENYRKKAAPFWDLMLNHCKTVIQYSTELTDKHCQGNIHLDDQILQNLIRFGEQACYCEGLCCFFRDDKDYARIIQLLDSFKDTYIVALCGLAYAGLDRPASDVITKLIPVFEDKQYVSKQKDLFEQNIYCQAMMVLSILVRQNNNDLEKSIAILNQGIAGLEDNDLKNNLRKELSRYQKRMFGGWKYN